MTIWCVRGRSVAILNDIVRLGHAVTIISRAASAVLRRWCKPSGGLNQERRMGLLSRFKASMLKSLWRCTDLKKSTRILAVLMAFAMLIGSFSVVGSAYQAYKGEAIKDSYNDIDTPTFTTEQYASMGLDELDRMLAEENLFLMYMSVLLISAAWTAHSPVPFLWSKAFPQRFFPCLRMPRSFSPPSLN